MTALGRCLGPAGRGGPGPGGAGRARPFCRPGAGVPLPEDVTEADLLTALDGLTAMAAGPEVPAMIRVGFEDKRARLEEMGLTGSMLARLDGLYGLYMDGASDALRSGLRARIGACLLYFILSADRVPDDLLPIGYLDDAWVVDRVWGESQAAGFVPPLGGGDGDPEENPGPCLPAQGTGVVVRGPGSPSVRGSRARPSSGQGPGEDPQDGPALSGTDPHTPRGKRPCPDA